MEPLYLANPQFRCCGIGVAVEAPGEIVLETLHDPVLGPALGGASGHVDLGWLAPMHPSDYGPVDGVPAPDPVVFPEQHTRAAAGAGRHARHAGAARPAAEP